MIRLNLIKDNKVATKDANLAEKVCSLDSGSLKGKSARIKLESIVANILKIPDELMNANKELKLSADELLVNGLNFATTIVGNLFHRLAVLINSTH